jgi:hypothetical protein
LALYCVLAAVRYGAEEGVFASLAESYPGIDWPALADHMIGRVVGHGERRAGEMEGVAGTLEALGIDPIMAAAKLGNRTRTADFVAIHVLAE